MLIRRSGLEFSVKYSRYRLKAECDNSLQQIHLSTYFDVLTSACVIGQILFSGYNRTLCVIIVEYLRNTEHKLS